jgi:hypothetical protein
MVLIPYMEDSPHHFHLLEFQFALDKKFNAWLVGINSDVKFGNKHWSDRVLQEEIVEVIKGKYSFKLLL